ncbi:MAG: hypothetical protein ABL985_13115 [Casimicrobium sp.]
MQSVPVTAIPFGDEATGACVCCGRPTYTGAGELRAEARAVADYWYQWTDGHEGRFCLAICPRGNDGEPVEGGGVAVLSAHQTSEDVVYTVLEPEESPWSDFGVFGPVLPRAVALAGQWEWGLFAIVDAVAANVARLTSRILSVSSRLN